VAAEPRVEDLLASIRKAMDQDIAAKEDTKAKTAEPPVPQQGSMMRGALREMRVAYERAEQPPALRADNVETLRARVATSAAANDTPESAAHSRKVSKVTRLEAVETDRATGRQFSGILSGASAPSAVQRHSPPQDDPPELRPAHADEAYAEDVVYEAPVPPRRPTAPPPQREFEPTKPDQYMSREPYRYPDAQPFHPPEPPPYPAQHAAPAYQAEPPRYVEQQQWPRGGSLMSPHAAQSARNSFEELAESLLSRGTSERMFEDMTRDMLRGMLRQWLDENLPEIVERMVREEIERVARRGR
jgi:cell pole-organizing protein PopZ